MYYSKWLEIIQFSLLLLYGINLWIWLDVIPHLTNGNLEGLSESLLRLLCRLESCDWIKPLLRTCWWAGRACASPPWKCFAKGEWCLWAGRHLFVAWRYAQMQDDFMRSREYAWSCRRSTYGNIRTSCSVEEWREVARPARPHPTVRNRQHKGIKFTRGLVVIKWWRGSPCRCATMRVSPDMRHHLAR